MQDRMIGIEELRGETCLRHAPEERANQGQGKIKEDGFAYQHVDADVVESKDDEQTKEESRYQRVDTDSLGPRGTAGKNGTQRDTRKTVDSHQNLVTAGQHCYRESNLTVLDPAHCKRQSGSCLQICQ